MSNEIKVVLLSAATSIFTTLISIKAERYNESKKRKKDEVYNLVHNNKELFNELSKLANNNDYFNVLNLKKCLEDELGTLLLLPKKLAKLFNELYKLTTLNGDELKAKEDEIKDISLKIVKMIMKIGVEVSELDK